MWEQTGLRSFRYSGGRSRGLQNDRARLWAPDESCEPFCIEQAKAQGDWGRMVAFTVPWGKRAVIASVHWVRGDILITNDGKMRLNNVGDPYADLARSSPDGVHYNDVGKQIHGTIKNVLQTNALSGFHPDPLVDEPGWGVMTSQDNFVGSTKLSSPSRACRVVLEAGHWIIFQISQGVKGGFVFSGWIYPVVQ